MTASVVGAIAPKLEQAEIERAKRKPVGNLDAYDCYLRGRRRIREMTRDAEEEARHLFYRAIELEPGFATPYAMAARCYSRRKAQGWILDKAWEEAEVRRLASRISVIGRDDALALCVGGFALAYNTGDLEEGAAMADEAVVLNPNLAPHLVLSGYIKVWLGQHEVAIERLMRSLRLSPLDPDVFNAHMALAQAHLFVGRYTEASSWAEKLFREQPDHVDAAWIAAACHALAGRMEQAHKAMGRARQLDPVLCGFPPCPSRVHRRKTTLGSWKGCAKRGCRNDGSAPVAPMPRERRRPAAAMILKFGKSIAHLLKTAALVPVGQLHLARKHDAVGNHDVARTVAAVEPEGRFPEFGVVPVPGSEGAVCQRLSKHRRNVRRDAVTLLQV